MTISLFLKAAPVAVAAFLATTSLSSADQIVSQATQKYPDKDFGHVVVQNIVLHTDVIKVDALGGAQRTHFYVTCQAEAKNPGPNDDLAFDLVFDLRDKGDKPIEAVFGYDQPLHGTQISVCNNDNADRVDTTTTIDHMVAQMTTYHTVHISPSRLDPSP